MDPDSLPQFFDSQQQAASLLGLDVYQLKQWKADGCRAFKHGRVYRYELLEWMAKHNKSRVAGGARSDLGKSQNGVHGAVLKALAALADLYEARLLTTDQFFDQTTAIVEASNHDELLKGWIQLNFDFIAINFPDMADAWKTHPKIMRWFEVQANVRISKKRSRKRSGG